MHPKSEVHNVDCLEYMRGLPDKHFDLVIADPPYWSPDENTGRIRTTGNKQSSLNLGEKMGVELYEELKRISKAQIIWGANNYGFPFKGFIVWDKTNIPDEFTMSKCEIASISENLSRVSKLFRCESTTTGTKRIHPTQKPIALYAWILKTYGGGCKTIFDPMMGSQSSRIAAWKLGFDYVGCELDKEYFEKGCARFDRECKDEIKTTDGRIIKQLNLFE